MMDTLIDDLIFMFIDYVGYENTSNIMFLNHKLKKYPYKYFKVKTNDDFKIINAMNSTKQLKLLKCGCYITNIDCYRLTNLTELYCSGSQIVEIPKELINLTELICNDSPTIKKIPKELHNLVILSCHNTPVEKIPKELHNLIRLLCYNTPVEKIYSQSIQFLKEQGLLAENETHYFLTKKGISLANNVFMEFLD